MSCQSFTWSIAKLLMPEVRAVNRARTDAKRVAELLLDKVSLKLNVIS